MSRRAREPFAFECERVEHFVDREEELARAKEVLSSPAGTALPVLVFHGMGGMGKSALLDKIRRDLCGWPGPGEERERAGEVPHAWADFSSAAAAAEGGVRGRTGMLHHMKRELDGHGLIFPRFELVWARYRELTTGEMFQPSSASRDDFRTLLDIIQQAPGVGNILGVFRHLAQLERFQRAAYGRFHLQDGLRWQHPYEAAGALPEALADDIAENIARIGEGYEYRWPVLFFDSLEWLDAQTEEGLTLEAIRELCEYLRQVPVIIGSRPAVDWDGEAIGGREIENWPVDVIPEGYREEFLEKRGVGEGSWEAIMDVSGGHALWMGIGADIALEVGAKEGRSVTRADLLGAGEEKEQLLERLLERLGGDRPMTETVRAACVCRWFDADLLEAVRGETDDFAGQFDELGELSFVTALERDEGGRLVRGEMHQTVRELVLPWLRDRGELGRLARQAAEYCNRQDGAAWEAEQVYFLTMGEPQQGLSYVGELFDRVKYEWNRELGKAVLEASRDGWRGGHMGEIEAGADPWQFGSFEGDLLSMEGNPTGALAAYGGALETARVENQRYGEGATLNNMAIMHRLQGRYEEALGLYEQSLEIFREIGDRHAEAQTLNNMAGVHEGQGRYEQAMGLYEDSLEIKRELGDRRGEGTTLNNMAAAHQGQGRYQEATRLYEQSLAIRREIGDRSGEGSTLNNMGEVRRQQGCYGEAMGLYEQSLEISRELGDRHGEGATLGNMAIVHEAQGRYDEGLALYQQALGICRELGDRSGEARTLNNMANVHQRQARYEEAMGLYEQSLAICQELVDRRGEARSLWGIGMVHGAQGRYERAMGLYEQSLEILRELGDRSGEGATLNNMAIVHEAQGRYEEAMGLYEQDLAICRELGDRHGEGQTLNNMAIVHEAQGRYEEAMGLYEQDLAICRELGDRHGEGQTLANMGRLAARTGDRAKARQHWQQALEALEGLGVPEAEQVREWLDELE